MADSLVFRALERHVIHGRADDMAFTGPGRPMTYAHLLHDSACVAGSLRDVGVGVGTRVAVDIEARREQIIATLACARLGAELDTDADIQTHRGAADPDDGADRGDVERAAARWPG